MKNSISSLCARCKKPEKIAKTWVEVIETRVGKSKLTHTQIVCTDKECQKKFEFNLAEDIRKKEELKMKNELYAKKRKEEAEAATKLTKKA